MPDPVVPPADTIRRAIWHSETCRREPGCDCGYCAANDALDALLAVGERDRRQIARLTEAIEDYILWEPGKAGHAEAHRRLRAVLAGEEDARPCTCTIACIPQGITDDQTCRLRLEKDAP